ncbi:MAG: hypothetical protein FWD48_07715 [Oscillospiraceae bacterium]|nr:hypothetical protein [Oscillospiraceae bacterium]
MKSNCCYDYGIVCEHEDELKIVKNINKYLKETYNYNKLYKKTNESLLSGHLPYMYKYLYCQFILKKPYGKDIGRWYFDLLPNSDLEGKMKYADSKNCGWLLFISKHDVAENTQAENDYVNIFFDGLINSIGYEAKLLHEYKDGEDRL